MGALELLPSSAQRDCSIFSGRGRHIIKTTEKMVGHSAVMGWMGGWGQPLSRGLVTKAMKPASLREWWESDMLGRLDAPGT